ncbi:MAG TPA: AAA family ATPase [Caulobacteraceae bacterium]
MSERDWLEANTRYLTDAIAWVRGLLQERAAPPPVQPAPQPPANLPAVRRSWLAIGRRAPPPAAEAARRIAPDPTQRLADSGAAAAPAVPPPALLVLTQRLGLNNFERNVLLLCAAMELDTSIGGLCAQAQGDPSRPYPTFALALTLFEEAAWDALSPERPLRYWRLIEITQPGATPLTVSPLRADECIVNFLKGVTYVDDRLDPLLAPLPEPQDPPQSQRAAAESVVRQLNAMPKAAATPTVQLLGTDAASKQIVSGLVCRVLGLRPYRLDWSLLPAAPGELESLARLCQRQCLLLPIALFIDAETGEGGPAAAVDRLLSRLSGVVFLATRNLWSGTAHAPIAVEVAKPTAVEQRAIWTEAVGAAVTESTPAALAAQFNMDAATIREVAQRETADPAADPASLRDRLWDACRVLSRPRLDTLAHRLVPRARWDDIVLPPNETALLHRVADQVAWRGVVYRDWGFAERMSRGLGISVLFAGATGTGKTMATEVLANHLRLDLFRIDLSAVVSKWLGETEANLRRLFDAAEDGGAILFFDEADALFGKRTEVKDSHDRYANIEINYLLQRMESYSGLAILATNMKSALDQAFLRRLRIVLDFPYPGAVERKAMWQKVFPAGTPTADLDFDRLARINVTGGHIAVIALNAAFQAAQQGGRVTMPIIFNAARLELRKLARPINERDFQWTEAAA